MGRKPALRSYFAKGLAVALGFIATLLVGFSAWKFPGQMSW